MRPISLMLAGLLALPLLVSAEAAGAADANLTLKVRQIVHTGEHGPSGKKAPGPSDLPKVPGAQEAAAAEPDTDVLYLYWEGGEHEAE